jgi:hypothetical protein
LTRGNEEVKFSTALERISPQPGCLCQAASRSVFGRRAIVEQAGRKDAPGSGVGHLFEGFAEERDIALKPLVFVSQGFPDCEEAVANSAFGAAKLFGNPGPALLVQVPSLEHL